MSLIIRNVPWLRALRIPAAGDFGSRMAEMVSDLTTGHNLAEQQGNFNLAGVPMPPPPIAQLNVTAQNGIFHASIVHPGDFYRGVQYHLEYAEDQAFGNPFPVSLGPSREWRGGLGNLSLHFRAAASYGTSGPTDWVYANGPVVGGGVSGPALPAQSQGSGTGLPGQGLQGPGRDPFRSTTGLPPKRVS